MLRAHAIFAGGLFTFCFSQNYPEDCYFHANKAKQHQVYLVKFRAEDLQVASVLDRDFKSFCFLPRDH